MNKEEVLHLAKLSRIELTEQEVESFTKEMSAILAYVGKVQELVGEEEAGDEPELGARYNVFRQDEVINQPEEYTKDLLAEMPKTEGRFMVVKKILQIE